MKRTRIELLEMRLASARTAQIMLLNQVLELKARVAAYESASVIERQYIYRNKTTGGTFGTTREMPHHELLEVHELIRRAGTAL